MSKSITCAFYEYPRGCGRASSSIRYIERLVEHLRSEYDVEPDFHLVDGIESYPEYASLLDDFLAECESLDHELDLFWVHSLLLTARHPCISKTG